MTEKFGRLRAGLLQLGVGLVLALILFALLEGFSSLILIAGDVRQLFRVSGDEAIIQYDPDLGVIYQPNVNKPDLYAPGVGLRTNSQSFRAHQDYTTEIPAGKQRLLCVGDSFTVGEGVANDQTWCHLLGELDTALETINLGQGGYGLDQMYLRYLREAERFQHNVVVFAFIANDLERMDLKHMRGARKPFLTLEGDRLVALNQPVPRFDQKPGWQSLFNPKLLYQLRLVELLHAMTRQAKPAPGTSAAVTQKAEPTLQVALKIFENLHAKAQAKGVIPIFVYLPTIEDYAFKQTTRLRQFLADEMQKRQFVYYDLTEELLQNLDQSKDFYLKRQEVPHARHAARHYSVRGHRFIATRLYQRFVNMSEQSRARSMPQPASA